VPGLPAGGTRVVGRHAAVRLEVDQHTGDPGVLKGFQRGRRQLGGQLDEGEVGLDGDVAEVAAVQTALIGDGPDFELEKKRTEELGLLGKNVFFTGLKEQNELVKEIQAADFMVLSSNYETFGTVVIECLSCGIPVIATNVGIVPEVINKTNGIIIPTGDQDALVAAIDTMLDQVNSYNPDAIRNSVLNKFDNHTIATQLLEIYNSSTHNTLFI